MTKPVTIAELQKEQPRTFEASATARNLENTKRLLTEAGAWITKTVKVETGLVRLYLKWPVHES